MPETMRLNSPVECPFCKVQVNPYVVTQTDKGRLRRKVECPNCGQPMIIELTTKISSVKVWRVVG